MQLARKAAPSSAPCPSQVSSRRPTRTIALEAGSASPTLATSIPGALELYNRIEVWVNEGGAGGEGDR